MLIRRHFVPSAGVPGNYPPVLTSFVPDLASPQTSGATIKFTASATDVESDPIEYRFYLDGVPQTEFSSTNYWEWVTDEDDVGPHTVTVYVRDNNHSPTGDDSETVEYTVNSVYGYYAVYPQAFDETYVKTTNRWFEFEGFRAIDPSLALDGGRYLNSWLTNDGYIGSQRLHVEFTSARVVKRIIYCNSHHDGYETNVGVKDFIIQGTNNAAAFANLTYADDTNWTTIATDVSTMVKHPEGYDGVIWNTINLTNDTAYKYYAIKCANNHGNTHYIGIRRLEFQILSVDNLPPTVTSLTPNLASPQPAGATITFTAIGSDPEGDALQYQFYVDGVAQTGFGSNSWAWETDAGDIAAHTVSVKVRDNNNNPFGDDTETINYTIVTPPEYEAVYPPAYNETYIKTTNRWFEFEGFRAVDPALSLSGGRYLNSWLTENGHTGSQRFHVEFASAQVIKRIEYCNSHHDGYETDAGVKDFTIQGSNSATAFANLTYADNTDWTDITANISSMTQHTEGYDGVIWRIIELTNDVAYKYYAIKCANNHGDGNNIGLRRVVFKKLV